MASTRSTAARSSKPSAVSKKETAPIDEEVDLGEETPTEPHLRIVRPPTRLPTDRLSDLQRLEKAGNVEKINVRLLIDGSDADGVRSFDELLPVAIVQAILDPHVPDFFIPIQGSARMKPSLVRSHWLHTSYIREVFVMGELPE